MQNGGHGHVFPTMTVKRALGLSLFLFIAFLGCAVVVSWGSSLQPAVTVHWVRRQPLFETVTVPLRREVGSGALGDTRREYAMVSSSSGAVSGMASVLMVGGWVSVPVGCSTPIVGSGSGK